MTDDTIISCRQLIPNISVFDYAGAGLDLDVHAGEIISLVGPDYTGKSDWLRAIAGVFDAQYGTLELLGKDIDDFSKADWVAARRKLAYVKSDNAILSAANALQNVILPARYHDVASPEQLPQLAKDLLTELGVYDLVSLPAYLRKDQRFKVAIARALILQPAALILDNPFVQLDAIATDVFQHFLLRRIHDENMSLLIVTHDVNFAITYSNRILFITEDEILMFDKHNRMQDYNEKHVQNYLNKNRMTC